MIKSAKSFGLPIVFMVSLLLGACTPDQERPPVSASDSKSAAASTPDATPEATVAAPAKYLKLESSTIDLCKHPSGLMSTLVSWDATALPADGVQIWLQSPGEARKLWTAAAAQGSERTGEWLQNGTKVILVAGHGDSTFEEAIALNQTPCAG